METLMMRKITRKRMVLSLTGGLMAGFLVIALGSGCGGMKIESQEDPEEGREDLYAGSIVKIDEKQDHRIVDVLVGDRVEVRLPEREDSSYKWTLTSSRGGLRELYEEYPQEDILVEAERYHHVFAYRIDEKNKGMEIPLRFDSCPAEGCPNNSDEDIPTYDETGDTFSFTLRIAGN
jgi:hypothetical protein